MRVPILIMMSVAIVGAFLVFMMSFTVRFTETAVLTTFGRADENSVVSDPGLRFKWPVPVQSVTIYDRRVRLLESRDETQQTRDQRQVIVGAFLTWRVSDPLAFYKSHRGAAGNSAREHYRAAEKNIEALFRSAMSEVGRFSMDDLFPATGGQSRVPELEAAILQRLRESQNDEGGYGIEVALVGIDSIQLPETATREVFEQMKSTRAVLAAEAQSRGESRAAAIRGEAETQAQVIRSFVGPRVAEIRALGELEAARWMRSLDEEPKLAEFLAQIEFMRRAFGRKVTLILPTSMLGLELFSPEGLSRFGTSTSAAPAPRESTASDPAGDEGTPR
jgi:membrane protease subunit HflC